jgi:hypothetical protein
LPSTSRRRLADLIHDIPTVAELIDRITAGAERLIRDRLVDLLGDAAKSPAMVASGQK